MDWTQVFFVLGAGLLCAGWVVVQQVVARLDPEQPGVEGKCHSCGPSDVGIQAGRRTGGHATAPTAGRSAAKSTRGTTGQTSGGARDRMSGRMSDGMSDRMSDRMSGRMSDRMSDRFGDRDSASFSV